MILTFLFLKFFVVFFNMWHMKTNTPQEVPCVITHTSDIIFWYVSATLQRQSVWLCVSRNYMLQTTHCPPVSPVLLVSLFPSKLHPGGRVRWWRASARLSSRRSHSCRGIWHSSSSSAPSRPSSLPAVLTWSQRWVEFYRGRGEA